MKTARVIASIGLVLGGLALGGCETMGPRSFVCNGWRDMDGDGRALVSEFVNKGDTFYTDETVMFVSHAPPGSKYGRFELTSTSFSYFQKKEVRPDYYWSMITFRPDSLKPGDYYGRWFYNDMLTSTHPIRVIDR